MGVRARWFTGRRRKSARQGGRFNVETQKKYKSFRFRANLEWKSAKRGVLASLGKPDLAVGSPPEFKGEPDIWCPEEMLVGAVSTCLMLTFLSLAQPKNLEVVAYEANAEGLLEHKDGKYWVTEITVQPSLVLANEADLTLARELMEKSKPLCFISNSVKAEIKVIPQFRVGSSAT
jgi:organic hydroperoxide reductase OsmC/OhrA